MEWLEQIWNQMAQYVSVPYLLIFMLEHHLATVYRCLMLLILPSDELIVVLQEFVLDSQCSFLILEGGYLLGKLLHFSPAEKPE